MSDTLNLSAEARDRAGKGASRALRRDGRVPAVIYGNKQEAVTIHVEEKALVKALSGGHFMNSVVMIDVGGKSERTLPKDVAFHPVTDRPVHVDFFRIGEHSTVNVQIPVRFVDEEKSPGIKRGGVLNVVHHEIELTCDAAEIPDEIVVSLDGREVGDSIHLDAIKLPRGSQPHVKEADFTIATIVAPSALKSSEGEDDTAAPEASEVPATKVKGDE
jgi:large subunit ribosomal protein L25